jgi:hypothetical protein
MTHGKKNHMRTWVCYIAALYGLCFAGLATRGAFLLPPWFFLLGSVVFVVPLGCLLACAGDLLARHIPERSPWAPWIAIAIGLVLVGIYSDLLAAFPIVFLVCLGVVGVTMRRGRMILARPVCASLLALGLGYAAVFALNYLCASLTAHTIHDATLWRMDLAVYRWLFNAPADGGGVFPLVRHPVLFVYLENAYFCMFAGIPLTIFVLHATGGQAGSFIRALFTCYLVALVIFLVFPTLGPTLAAPQLFDKAYIHTHTYDMIRQTAAEYTALRGGGLAKGSAYFVALPSMHVAVAVLVQVFLYRSRAHFWLFLPVNALVVPATVALGYHYLLDVPAGALLAAGVLAAPAIVHALPIWQAWRQHLR